METKSEYSLKPVDNELQKPLSRDVLIFLNNCIGPEVKKAYLTSSNDNLFIYKLDAGVRNWVESTPYKIHTLQDHIVNRLIAMLRSSENLKHLSIDEINTNQLIFLIALTLQSLSYMNQPASQ
ncbi:phosphoglycerate kinase 2 [Gigaspora margarita]|uniref:Phosphoglycerate kinase 2 n=1 Tax=Gigaspora margarita TaxID=4874 RepID=A0A8H4ENJ1_GIGMA|nr:phosphoglycerate kinase 2 [Gigaspora margarita]